MEEPELQQQEVVTKNTRPRAYWALGFIGLLMIIVLGAVWYHYLRSGDQTPAATPRIQNAKSISTKGQVTKSDTTIWAGYVATGKTFSVVEGRAKVPHIQCSSPHDTVAVWAGFDGYGGEPTVEQIGFTGGCADAYNIAKIPLIDGAIYYAWAMLFGAGGDSQIIEDVRIRPDDIIYYRAAHVSDNTFALTITNETLNQSKTLTMTCRPENAGTPHENTPLCPRDQAEWIVERSGYGSLAKFPDLKLYDNKAIADSKTYSPYNLDTIQLDMLQNGNILATAGPLSRDGSFMINWVQAGKTGE